MGRVVYYSTRVLAAVLSAGSGIIKGMGRLLDYIIILLGGILLVALLVRVYKIATDIPAMFQAPSFDTGAKNFVIDTLTIFVIIELLLGFMQYHGANKIAPVYILDAGLFFTTRELMIELYTGDVSYPTLIAFAVVIASLGYTRILVSRVREPTASDGESREKAAGEQPSKA